MSTRVDAAPNKSRGPGDPDIRFRADLAARVSSIIEMLQMNQVQAAMFLRVYQAEVSDLMRGRLKGVSTDRLFRYLLSFGQDVEIVLPLRIHIRQRGQVTVRIDPLPRPFTLSDEARKSLGMPLMNSAALEEESPLP